MALTQLELDTISRGVQAAKLVLEQLKPALDRLNAIYDPAGGAKLTITQDGLGAVPSFSGLTKQQLDDGMYALTGTLRGDVNNAYTQLAQLAARG